MTKRASILISAGGWAAFALGWVGIFLPGLPTTIFWILAGLAFLRTNGRMYRKIIANRRFGEGVRLFVEEGKIRARGKVVSITAMLVCACLGAFAIPPLWVKVLVVAAAGAGSIWVGCLPTPKRSASPYQSRSRSVRDPSGRGSGAPA